MSDFRFYVKSIDRDHPNYNPEGRWFSRNVTWEDVDRIQEIINPYGYFLSLYDPEGKYAGMAIPPAVFNEEELEHRKRSIEEHQRSLNVSQD